MFDKTKGFGLLSAANLMTFYKRKKLFCSNFLLRYLEINRFCLAQLGWVHTGEISENRLAQNKRHNYITKQKILICVQTDQILLKDKLNTINFR